MYQKLFQKQAIMRRVLLALAPIYLFALYLYGWRLLILAAVVFPVGVGLEYLFEKRRGKKVSEAALVTCSLFLLALPAQTPLWVAAIGVAFGIVFGKEIYGGFGRNIFNPAITGRLFIYITFPQSLQTGYLLPGRFGLASLDGVTTATPLHMMRDGESVELLDLLLGFRAGSMGESSMVLILLAAIYLIATNTANWRMIVSTAGTAALLHFGLDFFDAPGALPALPGMLSGSIIFVSVFYATDPVSAPKKKPSQFLYGVIIGSVSILVKSFSLFPVGTSFGIIVGNTFASLLDEIFSGKKLTNAPKVTKALDTGVKREAT